MRLSEERAVQAEVQTQVPGPQSPEVEVGRAQSGKEASVPGTEGARQRVPGEQIRHKVEEAGVQDLGGHRRTWMFTLKEMSSRGVT